MCIIWFNNPRALDYLARHGEVYTLRAHKKACPNGHVVVRSRYGLKARGFIKYVGAIDLGDPAQVSLLGAFVAKSGFKTVDEWVRAFRELNHNANTAYLYHVVIEKPLALPGGLTQGMA